MKLAIAACLFVAACTASPDPAASGDGPDGGAAAVVQVECASSTIAATVTTSGFAYSPSSVSIGVGEVVELHPTSAHDVVSSDNLFSVGFGGDSCFRFDQAGSYDFFCAPHQFHGTINVE